MEAKAENQDIHKQLAMARLPSLPQALLQIMDLSERDDVGLSEIGAVVSQDSGLAAKVLSTANSAFYSRGRSISNIDQCLSVMGAAQVRRIALNQSVAELFGRFKHASGFDMRHYWYHVLCVAITTRELARRLGYPNVDEAYLAGLLHDVGQLALLSVAPDQYLPIFKTATGEQRLMMEEQKAFGLAHPEIGAWLAQRWNLHSFLSDALLYHHEPLPRLRDAHALAQIVNLANLFNNLPAGEIQLEDEDLKFWGLTVDEANALVAAADDEAKEIADALGIEILPYTGQPRFEPEESGKAHANLAEAVSTRLEAQSTLPETLEGNSHEEVYLGILRSAKMLFASRNATLFLAEGGKLQGVHTSDDDSRLGEIRISLPAKDSAIARALDGQVGLAGENPAEENLADIQVMRIMGEKRLLCMQLNHEGAALGVLAVGMDADSARTFMQRKALITTFAREGGRRLALSLRQADLEDAVRADAQQQFQLHARKVLHEANNPLGVIRNYIGMLREELADKKQAQQDIDLVQNELRRVARILQGLKSTGDAASTASAIKDRVDINALINEVIRFCRLGRPELANVDTRLQLDSNLPSIRVNGDKVKQVLTNLIFNAAEAMPQGGEIAISSANWQSTKGQHSVEITVRDNGPGLPPTVLESLYQPVQSMKGGDHQGLGLSIIGKLVDELGGIMQCNTSQSGTSFKILLPASQ